MRSPRSTPARFSLKGFAGCLAIAAGLANSGQASPAAHVAPAALYDGSHINVNDEERPPLNTPSYMRTHRAIARSMRILALAGCLVAGAGISRAGAHASPALLLPYCATHHYLVGASAHESVLQVKGACFPFPSSVQIAIRDLTTGAVLRNWITIPVTSVVPLRPWNGSFKYVTQGDARPGDAIRFRIRVGPLNKILTVTDMP